MEELSKRFAELARLYEKNGRNQFTFFLTPVEVQEALRIASNASIEGRVNGGYPDAERCMVCFGDAEAADFPIRAVELQWPKQEAPQHRDLLGAVLGLGLKRECIGDIVIESDHAYVFSEERMAPFIAEHLSSAGRVQLKIKIADTLPQLSPPKGEEVHATVMSLRLDAVLSAGCHLSRGDAAQLIRDGLVKLNYRPCLKADERVSEGDLLSLRGYGRIRISEVGTPNRKQRLPLTLIRYHSSPYK